MPWSIDLKSLDGISTLVTGAAFRAARVLWAADGSGSVEVNLSPEHVASGAWAAGERRVIVKNATGTPVWGGFLGRLERGGPPGNVTYRAAALGFEDHLRKRVVIGDLSFVEQTADNIVMGLLTEVTSQVHDISNFTFGTCTGTPASLTRYYCDGDEIKAAIDELANRATGGFGWWIDPNGALHMKVGGRGSDLSSTYTLQDSQVSDWSLVKDTSNFATYALGIGDRNDDLPCGPPLVEDFNSLRTTFGRLEIVTSAGTTKEAEMLDIATEALRAAASSLLNLRVSWIEGRGPWAFGTVMPGDIIKAKLGAAFGGTTEKMRCISASISFEPGLHEFVELEFEYAAT